MAEGTRKSNDTLMVVSDDSTKKVEAERSHMVSIYFCLLSYSQTKHPGTPLRVCLKEGVDCGPLLGEEVHSPH